MTKTITDIVFETLSRHFELTTNGVYKHCAGQPGITNMKTVANALDRLRKQGCATSYRCEERGIYLWQAVKPVRQVVDPIEESPDQADDQCADASNMMGEMASDVAELEQPQPVINESLTTEAAAEESSDAAETDADKYRLTMTASLDAWGKGEDIAVEFKPAHKSLTVRQILDGFENSGESFQGDLCDFRLFAAGVEFAEKHHGISQ